MINGAWNNACPVLASIYSIVFREEHNRVTLGVIGRGKELWPVVTVNINDKQWDSH